MFRLVMTSSNMTPLSANFDTKAECDEYILNMHEKIKLKRAIIIEVEIVEGKRIEKNREIINF